jgi:hypothetical protein
MCAAHDRDERHVGAFADFVHEDHDVRDDRKITPARAKIQL